MFQFSLQKTAKKIRNKLGKITNLQLKTEKNKVKLKCNY